MNDNLQPLSDEQLFWRFQKSDDTDAIEMLFQRYTHLIFGLCMKYLKNVDDSRDAVADIFTKLLEKKQNYQIVRFSPWIYTVTKNHCLKIVKRGFKSIPLKESHHHQNNFMEIEASGDLKDETDDKIFALNDAVDTLDENQRSCIHLFYFKSMTYQQIATQTRYSVKQVKSYIQNGKRNLKIRLSECLEEME